MLFNILHTEWSDGWGGQELRIIADGQALQRLGHRVTILTVPGSQIYNRRSEHGLPVLAFPLRHSFDPVAVCRLVSLFNREKYHVVNTHSSVDSWLASIAAKIAGVPVLVRTRHLSVPLATHPFNFVYQWPDAIVTTAEAIRKRMIEVNRMDGERIIPIPTGVDLDRFDPSLNPEPLRSELGLAPGLRVMTMVAVLRNWKRHEVFLDAAARLLTTRKDVRFLIVGEGPRRPDIEGHIKALNLDSYVIMTGHRPDVPEILAISDIGVLTSESSEGVPQAILQYQAMAKPVVATAAGGIPEVIQHGRTGWLCPVNDDQAVAEAIATILDNPELARSLGGQARRYVQENYSLQAMARVTVDLYERIYRQKVIAKDH